MCLLILHSCIRSALQLGLRWLAEVKGRERPRELTACLSSRVLVLADVTEVKSLLAVMAVPKYDASTHIAESWTLVNEGQHGQHEQVQAR